MIKKTEVRAPSTCLFFALLLCAFVSCGQSAKQQQTQAPQPSPPIADSIAQADKLYAQREDLTHVREAIVLLRQVRANDQNNYEAAWRLARLNYYLGSHTQDQSERDKAFHEGIEAGRAAVKLQDNRPEGHFWLGANYGGEAEQSTLAGLASIDDIRSEMGAVIRIDEGYQSGSAHMVLCQLYLESPKIVGGDPQLALQECEKGLKYGQNNSLLRLHLAEAYIANKRPEDARKQIDQLMQMKPDPDYVPEHNEAVAQARELLKTKLQNSGANQR